MQDRVIGDRQENSQEWDKKIFVWTVSDKTLEIIFEIQFFLIKDSVKK